MHPFLFGFILIFIYFIQFVAFFNLQYQTDTGSFIAAVDLWAGDSSSSDRLMRLSKPLSLILPLLLNKIGFSPFGALLIQQHLAYWATLLFLYRVSLRLNRDIRFAQLLVILFAGAAAAGLYGLAALVDMLGWAVALALINLALWLIQTQRFNPFSAFFISSAAAVGFFIKENVATSCIFLFFLLFFDKNISLKSKLFCSLSAALGFLSTLLLGLWLTSLFFGYNLYDWIVFNNVNKIIYDSPFQSFVFQSFRCLDNGWILVFLGFCGYFKTYIYNKNTQNYNKNINNQQLAFILTGFIGFLAFPFVWNYYSDRIMFMFAPFCLYLAAYFLNFLGKNGYYLAFLAFVFNIIANFVVYNLYIPHFLTYNYLIFACIAALFLINQPKTNV